MLKTLRQQRTSQHIQALTTDKLWAQMSSVFRGSMVNIVTKARAGLAIVQLLLFCSYRGLSPGRVDEIYSYSYSYSFYQCYLLPNLHFCICMHIFAFYVRCALSYLHSCRVYEESHLWMRNYCFWTTSIATLLFESILLYHIQIFFW